MHCWLEGFSEGLERWRKVGGLRAAVVSSKEETDPSAISPPPNLFEEPNLGESTQVASGPFRWPRLGDFSVYRDFFPLPCFFGKTRRPNRHRHWESQDVHPSGEDPRKFLLLLHLLPLPALAPPKAGHRSAAFGSLQCCPSPSSDQTDVNGRTCYHQRQTDNSDEARRNHTATETENCILPHKPLLPASSRACLLRPTCAVPRCKLPCRHR